jgi:serine/threonine protein kinase
MIGRFHYDDDKLAQLLGNEPGGVSNEILAHLDTCKECQARLDTLSSGGLSWDEVNKLMRKDDLQVGEHGIGVDHDRESRKALSAAATFLQPSDHPGSFGRFARYEVMEFLGRGGMGIVMRTYDPELDRQCAVKVLAPELASNAAARRRFSREAKSAAAVVHPHVVPIQTVDEHGGLPYLVMPVVDGKSLQQRVENDGPLSIIETVRIASQVAEGLAAAHVQGLVHRDIKPANILLENSVERVQITDFGLARAIDDASMTRSGVIAGTPQYMSPEQAHGDAIDHRSDLFSLGSMLYFMLTGRSPFRAETTMGVLNRIGNDQPRSLRSIHSEVPEWLEAIVMKLLAKSREERFTSASEVAELLKSWYAHLQSPDTAPRPSAVVGEVTSPTRLKIQDSSPRPLPSRSRTPPWIRWLIATAAFALFALAGTIIYLETGKGMLRIESNSDAAVPITIRQGDEVVDHLTVTKEGTSTRLNAGEYVLQIDDADSEFIIADGEVMLQRGGQWLARIAESPRPTDAQELPAVLEHDYQLAEDRSQHALTSPIPATLPVTALGPPDDSRATSPLRSLTGSVEIRIADVNEVAIPDAFVSLSSSTQKSTTENKIHVALNFPVMDHTDGDGVVTGENVPPGVYEVSLKTKHGWRATSSAIVKRGERLQLSYFVPSPDSAATLAVDANFADPTKMALRLPFGSYKKMRGLGAFEGSYVSEDPNNLGVYEKYPSLTNGISSIGYRAKITVETEIAQPSGKPLTWTWGEKSEAEFLIDPQGISPIKTVEEHNTRGIGNGQRLGLKGNEYLGFCRMSVGESADLPHRLTIPTGKLTFHVVEILGKPDSKLLEAMGEGTTTDDAEVWLPAKLTHKSQWISSVIDTSGWTYDDRGRTIKISHLLRRQIPVEPGDMPTIRIELPVDAGR